MSIIKKKYNLNPETLMYEVDVEPMKTRIIKLGIYFVLSLMLAVFYFWIYSHVFGNDLPKTAILKKENAKWEARVDVLNRNMDKFDAALDALEIRNDNIYRSIFGMNKIPPEALNAGMGGVDFGNIDEYDQNSLLYRSYLRLGDLSNKAYVQTKSFDEVANLSKRAGDMASCRPAIPPINPIPGTYRISSSFGYRTDPVYGGSSYHSGVDFSTKSGTPVYSTGDGVVKEVKYQFYGYGYQVVIDHGFGYATRYAHLSVINVTEGMNIKRGECIALSGNTGKSTGAHLHYEVLYRGNATNPSNFYDLSISSEEYKAMTVKKEGESQAMLGKTFQLKTR